MLPQTSDQRPRVSLGMPVYNAEREGRLAADECRPSSSGGSSLSGVAR